MNIAKTKELLQKCIDAEMSLDEVQAYLETDLSQDPDKWIKDKGKRSESEKKEMDEYLNQKWPKKDGPILNP